MPVERVVIQCDVLPPIIDVDITVDHVEKVAKQTQGGAGPQGIICNILRDYSNAVVLEFYFYVALLL